MEKVINILTIIFTSTIISGVVSTFVTGIMEKNKFIFEKKSEAFTTIINQIISLINNIPYPEEEMNYTQIYKNQYLEYKSEVEKYILYLNKRGLSLLNEITDLFSKNVYVESSCAYDPNESPYIAFDTHDRKKIIKLKNELIEHFQIELSINKSIIKKIGNVLKNK